MGSSMKTVTIIPLLFLWFLSPILAENGPPLPCMPCKRVAGDTPLAGLYDLESVNDSRCEDGCSYSRNNDLYYFVPGDEVVVECGEEIGPTPGEEIGPETTMKLSVGESTAGTEVMCGMRRTEGECIKDGRVVNGQEAECNEWPWQVGIVRRDGNFVSTPFCGGTLVNENHVITAAHCMPNRTPSTTAVIIGDHHIYVMEPSQSVSAVSAIHNHPDYNSETQQHDITVIKLASKVNLFTFAPACFPTFATGESLHGQNGTISGWGALEYDTGDYPDTLQEVQDLIPIVNRETCVTNTEPYIYDSDILPGMLCAGGPGLGMDTCQGDSGGPLTNKFAPNRYQLVGVVSWGRNCAKSYGVYSDVAYYSDWIQGITGSLFMTP